MDMPADPATPFAEVYQSFYADLTKEGTTPSTIANEVGRQKSCDQRRSWSDASPHDPSWGRSAPVVRPPRAAPSQCRLTVSRSSTTSTGFET